MSSVRFELAVDDALATLAEELAEFIPKRMPRVIARDVLPPLQRQLDRLVDDRLVKRVPPPRTENSPPFVWSHDPEKQAKARRWFFRRYPSGYRRTGRLPRAWRGDITFDAQSFTIVALIENPADSASYVYGSEAFGFEQVPSHRETGWLNSGAVVPNLLLDISIQLDDRLNDAVDTEIAKL